MRAMTLTQPWAGLVASGLKLIENRPRQIVKREDFGKIFAIHASREIDGKVYERIYEIAPELRPEPAMEPWYPLTLYTSCVIGIGVIERAVVYPSEPQPDHRARDLHRAFEMVDLGEQSRWFFGPIGYVLRGVRALPTPVPCRGNRGFWTLTTDTAQRVNAQIAALR